MKLYSKFLDSVGTMKGLYLACARHPPFFPLEKVVFKGYINSCGLCSEKFSARKSVIFRKYGAHDHVDSADLCLENCAPFLVQSGCRDHVKLSFGSVL